MRNTHSQIAEAVRANGGATVQLWWNDNHMMGARDGDVYAVGGACDASSDIIPLDDFKAEDVGEAIFQARMTWWDKLQPTSCVGFWVNENVVHVDLVDMIQGRAYALQVAEARGELAIFSLKDQCEIWTSHGMAQACGMTEDAGEVA
jgi:hypothetical protein